MEPFESAWLKWGQAVIDTHVLRDNVLEMSSQPDLKMPSTYTTYYDVKRHCIPLLIVEVENPFPPSWGLLLGEIVHNYRCALDHIAWDLYRRGRLPKPLSERQEQNIGFPICSKRKTFNDSLGQKLPGVERTDRAIVRRFQPYIPGESRAHLHVFTVLRDLSNADKHRSIQPVVGVPDKVAFDDLRPSDCSLTRITMGRGFTGTLEPGAELAQFYVKKDGPNPHIDVQPRFSLTPAIHERLTLIDFLRQTMSATAIVLRQFSDPPPSLLNLVGPLMPAQT